MATATTTFNEPVRSVTAVRPRGRKIKETKRDRLFLVGIYAFLAFIAVIILFPLIYIVAASFSSASAVIDGKVWVWPIHPTLTAYIGVFDYPGVWASYLNSIIYTVAGTALSVTLSVLAGWPLSRPNLYGKRVFVWLLLFAFLFSGGIIPTYLVVKDLHMLNTRLSMIIPGALSIFSIILARSFFASTVPNELVEAAEVDGATDFTVLIRIVLPMSKPVLAVLALIFAVGQWNSYFYALIFLNSQNLFPLQLVLRQVLVLNQLSPSAISNLSPQQIAHFQDLQTLLQYSLIVIGSLPMLILYPLAQKYFVKGLRVGSLKG
jgi:ABC-type glycerol-3-phosphate transport system permease component